MQCGEDGGRILLGNNGVLFFNRANLSVFVFGSEM
jgi:hypothetical protein